MKPVEHLDMDEQFPLDAPSSTVTPATSSVSQNMHMKPKRANKNSYHNTDIQQLVCYLSHSVLDEVSGSGSRYEKTLDAGKTPCGRPERQGHC